MTDNVLLAAKALSAREQAYAPYSGFRVGAALLAKDGSIYTGCNIESISYSPTNCGERTAFFTAVAAGQRQFEAIAIAGGKGDQPEDYCYPCGVCLQVMLEFCDPESFAVIIAKTSEDYRRYLLKELLPYGFSPANVKLGHPL